MTNTYKRIYDFPAPHLNLITSSLGVEEPQLTTKTNKRKNKPTNMQANTQIQSTTSPNR